MKSLMIVYLYSSAAHPDKLHESGSMLSLCSADGDVIIVHCTVCFVELAFCMLQLSCSCLLSSRYLKLTCSHVCLLLPFVQLFQALAGLPGLEIAPPNSKIVTPLPAILKPKQLWSGKQVPHLIKTIHQMSCIISYESLYS